MTKNEAINAWMRGNDFRFINGYWKKDGLLGMLSQDLAAEMWRMSEGRICEARIEEKQLCFEKLEQAKKRVVDWSNEPGRDSRGMGAVISGIDAMAHYTKESISQLAHQPKETE